MGGFLTDQHGNKVHRDARAPGGAALSAWASSGALAVFELVRQLARQSGVNRPAWVGAGSFWRPEHGAVVNVDGRS